MAKPPRDQNWVSFCVMIGYFSSLSYPEPSLSHHWQSVRPTGRPSFKSRSSCREASASRTLGLGKSSAPHPQSSQGVPTGFDRLLMDIAIVYGWLMLSLCLPNGQYLCQYWWFMMVNAWESVLVRKSIDSRSKKAFVERPWEIWLNHTKILHENLGNLWLITN